MSHRTCWLNGTYVAEEQAHVSIFDRGLLFGDGIYEVAAVFNGKMLDADRHLARGLAELDAGQRHRAGPDARCGFCACGRCLCTRRGACGCTRNCGGIANCPLDPAPAASAVASTLSGAGNLVKVGPGVLVLAYEAEGKTQERMIPFVSAYIDAVDLAGRRITADWQPDY